MQSYSPSLRDDMAQRWFSRVMGLSLGIPLLWFALLEELSLPTILMYHAIDEDSVETKLSVSPEAFRRQMQFLNEHGYDVISLGTLVERLKTNQPIPWKTVVLTFDDGLRSVYTDALPILRQYQFPAIAFVIYDRVGQPEFMGWEEIRQWAQAGLEVGCHTYSHPVLIDPHLTPAQLDKEIAQARHLIELKVGHPVRCFSYPGGFMNAQVRALVDQAGYQGAVGTRLSRWADRADPFVLRRVKITQAEAQVPVFWAKISGLYSGWRAKAHR